jgi:hypothetical protein
LLANPYFQKINTLCEKSSIEVEGKDFYLDILMGGDMKYLQLVLGLGGSRAFLCLILSSLTVYHISEEEEDDVH